MALVSPLSGEDSRKKLHQTMTFKARLLSSFNQCADFPMLQFDLSHHSIMEWVKLSASAIRCTIAPCGRGFVFVGWRWMNGTDSKAHATVFYFDGDRQYFFDPSGSLKSVTDAFGYNVHKYFQWNHMWIPRSRLSNQSQLHVVDADLDTRRDQSIF